MNKRVKELPALDKKKLKKKKMVHIEIVCCRVSSYIVSRDNCNVFFFNGTKGPSTSGAYMLHHLLGHDFFFFFFGEKFLRCSSSSEPSILHPRVWRRLLRVVSINQNTGFRSCIFIPHNKNFKFLYLGSFIC